MIKRYLSILLVINLALFMWACSDPSEDDSTGPVAPENFRINTDMSFDGEIFLSWDQNTDNDLAGYILYRNAEGTDAAFDSIVTLDPSDTDYYDYGLDYSIEYFYKLRAFDKSGNKGDFSSVVSRISTNWNSPSPVQGIIIHAHNLSDESRVNVELRWSPAQETDFSYYIVYRDEVGAVPSNPVDTVEITEFTDTDVVPGTTYAYMIKAYDKGDYESNPSAIASDTPLLVPQLLDPIDIANPVSLTPAFTWSGVEHATSYRVQVKQSLFGDDLWSAYFDAGSSSSYLETYAGTALTPSTTYHWFISAYSTDPEDVNVRSEVKDFKTVSL